MIVRDDNDHKSPSFALATIRTPNHDTRLLFLMLFNDHGRQITGAGWSSNSGIEVGDVRHATTAIIHKTKKIRFAFAYKSGDEPSESFAINGKVLGNKTPRVFIVDLSGKEPSLVGINVELPKSVPDFTSDDARQVGREWKRMIAELKRSSPELQKFIDEYARQEIRQNDREKRSGESGEN
jgi:hypothetical protein